MFRIDNYAIVFKIQYEYEINRYILDTILIENKFVITVITYTLIYRFQGIGKHPNTM